MQTWKVRSCAQYQVSPAESHVTAWLTYEASGMSTNQNWNGQGNAEKLKVLLLPIHADPHNSNHNVYLFSPFLFALLALYDYQFAINSNAILSRSNTINGLVEWKKIAT